VNATYGYMDKCLRADAVVALPLIHIPTGATTATDITGSGTRSRGSACPGGCEPSVAHATHALGGAEALCLVPAVGAAVAGQRSGKVLDLGDGLTPDTGERDQVRLDPADPRRQHGDLRLSWQGVREMADDFDAPFHSFVVTQTRRNGVTVLGISVDLAAQVVGLPFYHLDPFDRLLVAQAVIETLPLVSADEAFDAYCVSRIW
jgi:hypothetical protein